MRKISGVIPVAIVLLWGFAAGAQWQSETVNWPVYYVENWSLSGTVTKSGATQVRVHFSAIDVEEGYDYLTTDSGNYWTGYYADVTSNSNAGSSIGLTLTSDDMFNGYFIIDRVEWLGTGTGLATKSGPLFDTGTWSSETVNWRVDYLEDWSLSGTVTKPGATQVRVHLSTIDVEYGYDYLVTDSGCFWSGYYTDVTSYAESGSSIELALISDFMINGSFIIDRVEWQGTGTGPATKSGPLFAVMTFTETPTGKWAEEGDTLMLTVSVTGAFGTVTYEWFLDGDLVGAGSSTYVDNSLALDEGGSYTCRATDLGTDQVIESPPALVLVFPAGSLPATGMAGLGMAALACIVGGLFVITRHRAKAPTR
jgi:hypothetical protein